MVVAAIKFDERRDQIASIYSWNKDGLGQAQTLKSVCLMDCHSSKNDEIFRSKQDYLLVYFLHKPGVLILLKYNKNKYLLLNWVLSTYIIKSIR